MTTARGEFDVRPTFNETYDEGEGAKLGRTRFAKEFRGDLEGTSTVEMLGAMSDVKGSAGYVAMERVTGRLHGRAGTFVLQHDATMTRGTPALHIVVVPDSATGELMGLTGSFVIDIVEKKHLYRFEYAFEA